MLRPASFGRGWRKGTSAAQNLLRGLVLAMPTSFGAQANTVLDLSGYRNDGSSTVPNSSWEEGPRYGKSISFSGSTNITVPHKESLNFSKQFAVSFWVRFTSTTSYQGFFDKYPGAASGFAIFKAGALSGKITFLMRTGPATEPNITCPSAVNDNLWHHVVCQYTGLNLEMYIDGDLVASLSNTVDMVTNTHDLFIGGDNASTFLLDGKMADFYIWNRGLVPGEVLALRAFKTPFDILESPISKAASGSSAKPWHYYQQMRRAG